MNEFCAKKLGEVLAFAKVGIDTLEKGFLGFRKLFTEARLEDLKEENLHHIEVINSLVRDALFSEIFKAKAEATVDKFSGMRELYVKKEWENPTELCEWLGFFEGGAVVHWTLVKGLGEAMGNKTLEELADKAVLFHEEILKTVSLSLYNTGKEKSA